MTLNTGEGAAIDTKPVEEAGESEGDAPESAESSGVRWLWLGTRPRLVGLRGEADECEWDGEAKGTTAAAAAPSDPSASKGTTQRRMANKEQETLDPAQAACKQPMATSCSGR